MTCSNALGATGSRAANPPTVDPAAIKAISEGAHGEPVSILGSHLSDDVWAVRICAPGAETAEIGDAAGRHHALASLDMRGALGGVLSQHPGQQRVRALNDGGELNHVDPDQFGPVLGQLDGTALSDHQIPREGYHPEWNLLIYNFGRREVNSFLIANALYWTREHQVDELRVDAVASMLYRDDSRKDGEWLPDRRGGRENLERIDFLRCPNSTIHGDDPSAIVIVEVSTSWPGVSRPVDDGGLGFGFKWNMGWMSDKLGYMAQDPMNRAHHDSQMSFGLDYAFSENLILSLGHEEGVHGDGSLVGKMPGDTASKLANLRACCAFMRAHPGKTLLLMGQEFGQAGEWNADWQRDGGALEDPGHSWLSRLVRHLNRACRDMPALHARDWRLGLPKAGFWREILNTDVQVYRGGDRGNRGGVAPVPEPSRYRAHAISLTLLPLGGLYLTLENG